MAILGILDGEMANSMPLWVRLQPWLRTEPLGCELDGCSALRRLWVRFRPWLQSAPPDFGVSFVLVSFSPNEAWGRPFLCQKRLGMTGSMPPGVRLRPWLPQHPLVVGVWVRLRRGCSSWKHGGGHSSLGMADSMLPWVRLSAVAATAPPVIGASFLGLSPPQAEAWDWPFWVFHQNGQVHAFAGLGLGRGWGSFPKFHGGGHSPP